MLALEEWEMESILQWKANALDRLVAAGKIREIDRERVTFIVRLIAHPPKRRDDPLPENIGSPRGHKSFSASGAELDAATLY
jgi:hypothetical protein